MRIPASSGTSFSTNNGLRKTPAAFATASNYALDSLHVVFAVNSGCTHFLSYDANTRQRAFAVACGLKVLPEELPD
jgi:hypothetical protein